MLLIFGALADEGFGSVKKIGQAGVKLNVGPAIKEDFVGIKRPSNDLHLICHEKSPYTGTYTLTHQNISSEIVINRPDIQFKIYFDAKLLEATSICNETRINSNHPLIIDCSDLSFQLELNLFMLRWLDYCLDRYNGAEWVTRK